MSTHINNDELKTYNFIDVLKIKKEFISYEQLITKYFFSYMPIKPSPMDYKNIRFIKLKNEDDYFQTKVSCVFKKINYCLEFSDGKSKVLIPYTYANKKIVIDGIFQNSHLALTSERLAFPNGLYSINCINEIINDAIEQGISIWFDNCIKKHGTVPGQKYKTFSNNFTDIIKTMKEIVSDDSIPSLAAPIGFYVKRADDGPRYVGFDFKMFLRHIVRKNNHFFPRLFRLNRAGMILDEIDDVKSFPSDCIIPSDLAEVIETYNSISEEKETYYQAVALLRNKDIVVIRKGELRFLYRNNKWYNLSFNYFLYTFQLYYPKMQDFIIRILYEHVISHFLNNREMFLQLTLPDDSSNFEEMLFNKYPYLCFKNNTEVEYDLSGLDEYNYELIKRHKERNIPLNVIKIEKTYFNDLTKGTEIVSINHKGDLIALLNKGNFCIPDINLENSGKLLSEYGMIIHVSHKNSIMIYLKGKLIYQIS